MCCSRGTFTALLTNHCHCFCCIPISFGRTGPGCACVCLVHCPYVSVCVCVSVCHPRGSLVFDVWEGGGSDRTGADTPNAEYRAMWQAIGDKYWPAGTPFPMGGAFAHDEGTLRRALTGMHVFFECGGASVRERVCMQGSWCSTHARRRSAVLFAGRPRQLRLLRAHRPLPLSPSLPSVQTRASATWRCSPRA